MTRDEFHAALLAERYGEPVREYRPAADREPPVARQLDMHAAAVAWRERRALRNTA